MFDVKVTEEQLRYAADMVERFNFGQRGRGDGNKREQLTGILGQTVFADLINAERPNGATGFDGGKDFEINHKRVDIKTMTRSVPMRPDFVHNFVGYQKDYPVDYYVFASFNKKKRDPYRLRLYRERGVLSAGRLFPGRDGKKKGRRHILFHLCPAVRIETGGPAFPQNHRSPHRGDYITGKGKRRAAESRAPFCGLDAKAKTNHCGAGASAILFSAVSQYSCEISIPR